MKWTSSLLQAELYSTSLTSGSNLTRKQGQWRWNPLIGGHAAGRWALTIARRAPLKKTLRQTHGESIYWGWKQKARSWDCQGWLKNHQQTSTSGEKAGVRFSTVSEEDSLLRIWDWASRLFSCETVNTCHFQPPNQPGKLMQWNERYYLLIFS